MFFFERKTCSLSNKVVQIGHSISGPLAKKNKFFLSFFFRLVVVDETAFEVLFGVSRDSEFWLASLFYSFSYSRGSEEASLIIKSVKRYADRDFLSLIIISHPLLLT